ncbi:MAG: V-type ATP synthase subunit D [Candidatus Omnitrophota bacterium]
MAKIKLTKGELKRQRDALKQYERYLPTLQLKKQQLQIEIIHQLAILEERKREEESKINAAKDWIGLLTASDINISKWIIPKKTIVDTKNVAGIDLPIFNNVEFDLIDYDLFITPLWVDYAIEALRAIVYVRRGIHILEEGIKILREELHITTQRVNLFEKIKIPQAKETIRIIKIYLGDQMANAVGRSKMAKRKIEETVLAGAGV